MAYLQRSLNVVVTSFTLCFISCCANAGKREQFPRRCEILSSQPCTRTMVTAVTATIIGASLSFGSLASSLPCGTSSPLAACRKCGFRSKRSTVDMTFSVRQLQEKCREQQQALFIAFIDVTEAFDLVSRDALFKILPVIGCPTKFLSFPECFHNNMHGTVRLRWQHV